MKNLTLEKKKWELNENNKLSQKKLETHEENIIQVRKNGYVHIIIQANNGFNREYNSMLYLHLLNNF